MKYLSIKLAICFLITLFFSTNTSRAQIFLDGNVYNYVEDGNAVNVTVFEDELLYENTTASKKGKFRLRLDPNHKYVISLSKEGHYTTKIAVDTHLPFTPDSEFFVEIPVETDLVQSYVGMDPEVMKKPLSKFYYNPKSESFVQDDKYLQLARQELEAFLYDAQRADTKGSEELDEPDLDADVEDADELAENSNSTIFDTVEVYTASKTEEKKTYKELDELAEQGEKNSGASTVDNNSTSGNQRMLADNSGGPQSPEPRASSQNANAENTNLNPQDSLTDKSENTILQEGQNEEDYVQNAELSISINGHDYKPGQSQKLIIDDSDIEVEVHGVKDENYSQLQYKLDSEDSDFKSLTDKEVKYNDLADGNYTFTIRDKRQSTSGPSDLAVPFQVKSSESDSSWIYIIAGIAALLLIFILARRKKRKEDEGVR